MNINLTVHDILEIVFRHLKMVIAITVTLILFTLCVLLFFPRTYRSEARMYLKVGRESVAISPEAATGPSAGFIKNNREEEIKSALEIVNSPSVFLAVVDQLGPDYILEGGVADSTVKPNPITVMIKEQLGKAIQTVKSIDPVSKREEARIEIEKNFAVEAERNSLVLKATFDSPTPEGAQKILSTLIEAYKTEHRKIHRNEHSMDFLAEQRDLVLKQYDDAKKRLMDAKNQLGIVTIDGRKGAIETQLQTLEMNLLEVRQKRAESEATVQDLTAQLDQIPEREVSSQKEIPNEGLDSLHEELYKNEIQLMDLKAKLNEDHPRLIATQRKIDEAKEKIAEEQAKRFETVEEFSPVFRTLKIQLRQEESALAGLQAREAELLGQQKDLIASLEDFNKKEVSLQQLEHEVELTKDKFMQYSNSYEQARIDAALESSQISSIETPSSATLQEKPVSPSKLLVLAAGAFLVLVTNLFYIFVYEKLVNRLRREGEVVELLKLPVLGSVDESRVNRRVALR